MASYSYYARNLDTTNLSRDYQPTKEYFQLPYVARGLAHNGQLRPSEYEITKPSSLNWVRLSLILNVIVQLIVNRIIYFPAVGSQVYRLPTISAKSSNSQKKGRESKSPAKVTMVPYKRLILPDITSEKRNVLQKP